MLTAKCHGDPIKVYSSTHIHATSLLSISVLVYTLHNLFNVTRRRVPKVDDWSSESIGLICTLVFLEHLY